jgi:NitT/TauT family transport system substrate-binding protein
MKSHQFKTICALLWFSLVITTAVHAAPLKPYRVGYNSWIGDIGLFVAQEKGYFKDEGLDVKSKSFSSPGDGLKPLLADELDAHFTTVDSTIIALDKAPGKRHVVYLTDTSFGADAIVAKPEIADVSGLKGKKVAATVGECNHLLLLKALEKANLKESDIDLKSLGADDAGAAFVAGNLDAAVTWEPWITNVSAEKKGHIIFSSRDVPNLILDCVTISDTTKQQKSAETKAFLRALNKANEFVIKNPKAAGQLAAKALDMKADDVVGLLPKVKLYGKSEVLGLLTGGASGTAKDLAEFFKARGVNATIVDPTSVHDPTLLQ